MNMMWSTEPHVPAVSIGATLMATSAHLPHFRYSGAMARDLTDTYIKPFLRTALARLLLLSQVSRRWAHAAAPWFCFLYYHYAGVLQQSHRGLYGKRCTLPPELCRRYLVLGMYQPASRLGEIVLFEQQGEIGLNWAVVLTALQEKPIVLGRPTTTPRETPYESAVLSDEEAAIAHGLALPFDPDPEAHNETYSLIRVHSFRGYEKVAPPLAGNRAGWLAVVRRRVLERQALSAWHHGYARDTAAILSKSAGRGKDADWYRMLERNEKKERKRRKREREEGSEEEEPDTAPRRTKRPRM